MAGVINQGSIHLVCGGFHPLSMAATRDCFAVWVSYDRHVTMAPADQLPARIHSACYASDGRKMAIAGGIVLGEWGGSEVASSVLVLGGV